MMALTQENVHYTLNGGPDVIHKSNRVHARIQSGQYQLILQFTEWIQWFYYRGEEGSNFFQGEGVSKEAHITCDFPGGGGGVRIP